MRYGTFTGTWFIDCQIPFEGVWVAPAMALSIEAPYNTAKYEGKWSNGKLYGHGTYEHNDGGARSSFYTGEFVNDMKRGLGTMTYANGDIYTGKWMDDKKSGYGIMKYANGDLYEGQWIDDSQKMTWDGR